MKEVIIARWRKNATSEIHLRLKKVYGRRRGDLRIFVVTGKGKGYYTRKGISFDPKIIRQLRAALGRAQKLLNQN